MDLSKRYDCWFIQQSGHGGGKITEKRQYTIHAVIALCVVLSLMPLAGAAENQNLVNNSSKQDINQSIVGSNATTYQSLIGLSKGEISTLQKWLENTGFNANITSDNLTISNLTIGATGENVIALQKWLKEHNFYTGKIDGQFGNATRQAVKLFQKNAGIVEDGGVGIQTLQAMEQWDQTIGTITDNSNSQSSSTQKIVSSKSSNRNYSTRSYTGGRGTGDCWDNSAILYNKLTSSGVKSRIIQYGTSLSPRHRSVQIYQNGAWIDYNYKANGYAKRYYATSSKPGMTVIT